MKFFYLLSTTYWQLPELSSVKKNEYYLLLNRVFWFSKRSIFFQVNIFTDQLDFRLHKFKRLPLHESPTKHSNTTDWVFLTVRRLSIILLSYFSGFLGACYECF